MYFANDIFPYFNLLHIVYECLSSSDIYILIYFYIIFMSVGWDVKLCPVSRTTLLAHKGRLVRAKLAVIPSSFPVRLIMGS